MTQRIDRRLHRTISRLDDQALIVRVRTGDDLALGELYRRHAPAATRAARSFTRSPYDADDVVSDVFCSIWAALRNGRGPADRFEPYLIAAVRNRCRIVWSNTVETHCADERSIAVVDRDPVMTEVAGSFASRAFRQLTEREREMLWLTAVEGRTSSEAASAMSLSQRAAATLKFRAKRAFAAAYLSEFAAAAARPECHKLVSKLSSYVRGSCRSRARRAVESHLQMCTTCRELADELAHVTAKLRSIGLPAAGVLASRTAGRGWRGSLLTHARRVAAHQPWLKPAAYVAAAGSVVVLPATTLFGTDRGVPDPQAFVIDGSRKPTEHDLEAATPKSSPPPSIDADVDAPSVGATGSPPLYTPAKAEAPTIGLFEVEVGDAPAASPATPAPSVDTVPAVPPPSGSSRPASSPPPPASTAPTPTSPAPAPVTTIPSIPRTDPPDAVAEAGVEVEVGAEVEFGPGAEIAVDVAAQASDGGATVEATVPGVDAEAAITADDDSVAVEATAPALTAGDVTVLPEIQLDVDVELPLGG